MRSWALLVTLLATVAISSGCGSGMAMSESERRHQREKVFETDMKQLVDDWDMIWLNDRPLRTSPWSTE